ncbi:hypothetical protein M422DRAFT_28421 [Sphaerobolus stellatus SS14]|nr:hypothetical protein M422DRAFT_28421 [Sphaerobolus stellatus SS14]
MPAHEWINEAIVSPWLSVMPEAGRGWIWSEKIQYLRGLLELPLEYSQLSVPSINLPSPGSLISSIYQAPMRLSTVFVALFPALSAVSSPTPTSTASGATTTPGSTAGSPSQPYIFIDNGYAGTLGFLTTVSVSGVNVAARIPDYTLASNSYMNRSIFMVQPSNATSYQSVQLLTTEGPTGPAPKGLNFVAVQGTQAEGSPGFFISQANINVFNANTNIFRTFVHCPSITVPGTVLPQIFWAPAGVAAPNGCFDTQWAARSR